MRSSLQDIKDAAGTFEKSGIEVSLGSISNSQIGFAFSVPSLDKSNGSLDEFIAKNRAGYEKNKETYALNFDEKNINAGTDHLPGIELSSIYKNVLIRGTSGTGALFLTVFSYKNNYFAIRMSFVDVGNSVDIQKYIEIYHEVIGTVRFH